MDPKQKFKEEDIPGAKLTLPTDKLSGDTAVTWLQCHQARKLSKLTSHELRLKYGNSTRFRFLIILNILNETNSFSAFKLF